MTSRLHCYLPVRAIGVPAQFRPKNRSDIRFDGLIDLDDGAFGAIREGLLRKLRHVHGAILTGRPEPQVYELWRELNAADVEAARERLARPARLPPADPAFERRVRSAVQKTVTHGAPPDRPVHCAVVLSKGEGRALEALVDELRGQPLHLWILARPGTGAIERRLADRAAVSRVPVRGLRKVTTLVLAHLLPAVDRIVLLRPDALAGADVAVLAQLDLGGHAFAAPDRPGVSGFGVIHRAAARLRVRTEAASELRRTAHARHRFDFDAFGGELLVLDLDRMRRDRFSSQALPLVQQFGLRELEVLHYLAGPDRATIPPATFTLRRAG